MESIATVNIKVVTIRRPITVNGRAAVKMPAAARAAIRLTSQSKRRICLRSTPIGPMSHHFQDVLNDANFEIFYHARYLS